METPLPTRTQLERAFEFIASFAGSSYGDDAQVCFRDGFAVHDVPEEEVAKHRETWLRTNRDEIIDYMVESDCAVENPQRIEPRPCGRTDAHGGPHRLFNDPALEVDYECPGIKAHPRTQIGRGEKSIVSPPPDGKVVIDSPQKMGRSPMVSTHRNAQMLRDMGHDV